MSHPAVQQTPDPITLAKRSLRQRVLAAREQMSVSQRAADSSTCIDRLVRVADFETARVVLSYVGFGSEVATMPIFKLAREAGKTVALPRMQPVAAGQPPGLSLHRVDDVNSLVDGLWGIREPANDAPPVELAAIDLVVIPGVAFDRRGGRLGYGKGYYDRLLSTRAKSNAVHSRPVIVALAFDCQVVDDVPLTDRDEKIDVLITPTQFIDFRS
jgi:5-formyltetrahydrofolate cyclo-ligase